MIAIHEHHDSTLSLIYQDEKDYIAFKSFNFNNPWMISFYCLKALLKRKQGQIMRCWHIMLIVFDREETLGIYLEKDQLQLDDFFY